MAAKDELLQRTRQQIAAWETVFKDPTVMMTMLATHGDDDSDDSDDDSEDDGDNG